MNDETQKAHWERKLEELDKETPDLKSVVKEFLRILNSEEESDSGIVFKPTCISSCRVWHSAQLDVLITKMQKFIAVDE